MLSAQDLSYTVKNKQLLNKVHFALKPGVITAIIGANGAGKSTLIKLLSGDLPPSSGDVCINNVPLNRWAPQHLAQTRAVMLQQPSKQFEFTVMDYLMLARSYRGESNESSINTTAELMEKLDLIDFSLDPINQLSGGEAQRVMFAKAWLQVASPNNAAGKLLLLDEPTSALDIRQQRAFFRYVSAFCEAGGTVLCVLHDINTAARFADQLLLIKNGHQLAFGNVTETFTTPLLQSCFDVVGEVFAHKTNQKPQFMMLDHV